MDDRDPSSARDEATHYVIAVRRMLKEAVSTELVLNPAVDMLLTLYVAREQGPISATDVCAQTNVVPGVCHRWAGALRQRGLIDVDGDLYSLTDTGRRVMDGINDRVWAIAADHLGVSLPST